MGIQSIHSMNRSDGWVIVSGDRLIGLFDTEYEAEDWARREFDRPDRLRAVRILDRSDFCSDPGNLSIFVKTRTVRRYWS